MTTQRATLSVTLPVSQAMDRVKRVLFQPFDLGRWFIIGFCAWLAVLGEGGGFHGGFNFGEHHGGGQEFLRQVEQARDYVLHNLVWIAPLAIAILLISLVVWGVILFLSSRGRFMFLHCVAFNRAEVQVPWNAYAPEANSLFGVRVVLALLGTLCVLPLMFGLLLAVLRMAGHHTFNIDGLFMAMLATVALVIVSAGFWVISRVVQDFVVPIQFLRRSRCLDAWREARGLLAANLGNFALYLLFRILLAIVVTILIVILVVATCCIAGCLFALPYVGTVLLLPVLVFKRAYSLHYLAQFGPEYDVFLPPVEA